MKPKSFILSVINRTTTFKMSLRVNTLWCELVQDEPRPNIKEMLNWVFEDLKKLTQDFDDNLIGIQYEYNGMYLKFTNIQICQELIDKTNGKSKIRTTDGNIANIQLTLSSIGTKRIRIFRLPFELDNKEIAANLTQYGEILKIEDEYWSETYATQKLKYKNGNRVATCKLTKHIPSFVIIKGIRALITYEGQPKTCSYCSSPEHMIAVCPNKQVRNSSYRNAVMGETQKLNQDPIEEIIITDEMYNETFPAVTTKQVDTLNTTSKRLHVDTSSEIFDSTTSGDELFKLPSRPISKKTKTNEDSSSIIENLTQYDSEDNESTSSTDGRQKHTEEDEEYASRRLETLTKVKKYIEHRNNPLSLTVNQLDDLLEQCQNSKSIMEPIKNLTEDIDSLAETLRNIRPYIKNDKRTKTWITKIITKITEFRESQSLILGL